MRGLKLFVMLVVVFLFACDNNAEDLLSPRPTPGPMASVGIDPVSGATIETDQDDYVPGQIVHVTGSGWVANETVHLFMTEDPDRHGDVEQDAQADSAGAFSIHFYDVQEHDLGVTFTLTATGQTSGSQAVAVFWDGNLQFQPNATPNPFSPNADAAKDALAISYRNQNAPSESGVTINIRQGTGSGGTVVRQFSIGTLAVGASGSINWDGKNSAVPPVVVDEGEYSVRIFSSTQSEASAAGQRLFSALVDYSAPVISSAALSPASAIQGSNTAVTVTGIATDNPAPGVANNNYKPVSAEYSIDAGSFSSMTLSAGSGPNVKNLSATIAGTTVQALSGGSHLICIRSTDDASNRSADNANCVTLQIINPDVQAPIISCSGGDLSDWHDTNVFLGCTASDAGSGLASSGDAAFSLMTNVPPGTETAGAQTGSHQVCDNNGNCATAGPYTFKVDRKAPSIVCGVADGLWHGSDVSINCTASDGGSGLANTGDASFSLSTSVPSGTETTNASTGWHDVVDAVGNTASAGPIGGNKVDKKSPVVSCGLVDELWHGTDVSISCAASDGGSGLANAGDASFSLSTSVPSGTETSNASTGWHDVADAVGNTESAGPIGGNRVDKKSPVVSCGSADELWHGTDVSISCTASDGGSGLANAGDVSFSLSTSVPSGSETNNASTDVRTIMDAVGNGETAGSISGNKVDKKGPVVTLTCPSSPVILGSSATASWTATDGGSGVAPGYGSGAFALETGSVGYKDAIASAGTSRDNVANNSLGASCGYSVIYRWTGFFQPVDNNAVNVAKAGSAIPVKFNLGGFQGLAIFSAGYPNSRPVACDGSAAQDLIEETVTAGGSSLTYDNTASQYVYVWKSDKSWAGTCRRLDVKLIDGTTHSATFNWK